MSDPYPDDPDDLRDRPGPVADRIVVGVDGSPAAARALRWALAEARRTGATVEAVHAYEVPPYPGPAVEWMADWVRADAGALLDRVVAEATAADRPGVVVRASVRRGPAGMALVKAAAGARLLVLGSHGHGPLPDLLLGSVAQHCAVRAPCPVVVLPPGDRTASGRPATSGRSTPTAHEDGR